jgi:hypothetical protein
VGIEQHTMKSGKVRSRRWLFDPVWHGSLVACGG